MKESLMSICSFYGISPTHAGSGMSTGAVDLPIQRERHTNWPHIQASAVKGSMRSAFRERNEDKELINIIFGSDDQDSWGKIKENASNEINKESLPGAIAVSDAKLLAFPVRSNIAPFVWITCPAVLTRLKTDLEMAELPSGFNIINSGDEYHADVYFMAKDPDILLEDVVVHGSAASCDDLPDILKGLDRLLVVSDSVYKYCVESCTEVQTQIKINSETGTAQTGALRYEELLPSDSLLYSVVNFGDSVFGKEDVYRAKNIKESVQCTLKGFMQIGGDSTLGRGIFRIEWLEA